MRSRFARIAGRHEDGTAPRAVVAHQLFQTPAPLAAQLVELLAPRPGDRILEPSAGLGRLLDALQPCEPAEILAIDAASPCVRELSAQGRDRVRVIERDFLTVLPDEIGYFDAIAMNPPFTMRADIRHIEHARSFLKPGGRLAALMMDTEHRERALRHDAEDWIEIPAGTFQAEGTKVPAILALFIAPIRIIENEN